MCQFTIKLFPKTTIPVQLMLTLLTILNCLTVGLQTSLYDVHKCLHGIMEKSVIKQIHRFEPPSIQMYLKTNLYESHQSNYSLKS